MATKNNEDNLLPRRYQEEVFARAKKENIIAALTTGSGKTLISLLLIKWISAQETSQGKIIVFLVPKVTLVSQQGDYIKAHSPDSLRILKLSGALDIDLSNRPLWQRRFRDHDVFVMTAQIFLNILTHALWSIDKVSLMIFDECHHARKNHPYNGILREYFQVFPPSRRPKVFGMTASPIWNPKDAIGSLSALEANMDAKVISVLEHVDELSIHSSKPVELVKEYSQPLSEYDYPFPTLQRTLSIFDSEVWDQLNIPWDNIQMRYFSTLYNLGPYCASLFLYLELKGHINVVFSECQHATYHCEDDDMSFPIPQTVTVKTLPPELFEVRDILVDYDDFFLSQDSPNQLPITVPLHWCTPKIQELVDILRAYSAPTFQGIIFVEQRQVASCLSKLLPNIPELEGLIRCAHLVGQGVNSEGVSNNTHAYQGDAVKMFRSGDINILIATSVAEEGLDFPACDLVIRFDPLQHMVGYVQSRGRARSKVSTFVIMIQKDDIAQLARYKTLQEKEPEVNLAYQTRHIQGQSAGDGDNDNDDDDADEVHPSDLAERERYVVQSTGAVLTYDNSINLLNYLCSTIPRDSFTPAHVPKYKGDFKVTLQLPPGLPLAADYLTLVGPPKLSKKEARRAVAFKAVKQLHQLEVYDNFLLPVSNHSSGGHQDIDGQCVTDVRGVPVMMRVQVKDPWVIGPRLWIHPIRMDGRLIAGLITGTTLPQLDFLHIQARVQFGDARLIDFHEDQEFEQRAIMEAFTKLGIWYRITRSPISLELSLFLVPIMVNLQPDFRTMTLLLEHPYGNNDWSEIGEKDYDRLLVMNSNEFGRVKLLRRVRHDLSPASSPLYGSREDGFLTYRDYFQQRWTRKKRIAQVPASGPLLETQDLTQSRSGAYTLDPTNPDDAPIVTVSNGGVVPRDCCSWINISMDVSRAFEILPVLCRRITDLYRAQRARQELGLPLISSNLLIEAFTLPAVCAKFSNQRLETLGDAVLQLCTSVHLFNKYPNRHEGQLTILRQLSVSNNFLLSRAKDLCLEQFLTCEMQSVSPWRYVIQDTTDSSFSKRVVSRQFPRRSLQDCMEATLGASFLSGGIELSLRAGTSLGLAFGGPIPWQVRYGRSPIISSPSSFFAALQDRLGYQFRQRALLIEAVTHPSFASNEGPSYQRLEFLGDAVLDLVVVKYLYDKFPKATSHELAWPRTRAICAQALAWVSVKHLDLHKALLANNVELNNAIHRYVPILAAATSTEIVLRGWRYDPPKAISDIFESVIGAVLVDSGYDYDKITSVVEFVMKDLLEALSPSVPKDPISELVEWLASMGCRKHAFQKLLKVQGGIQREGIAVYVHGVAISGPIVSSSLNVAKFVASERALTCLQDVTSDKALSCLCDCGKKMVIDDNNGGNAGEIIDIGDEDFDNYEEDDVDEVARLLLENL